MTTTPPAPAGLPAGRRRLPWVIVAVVLALVVAAVTIWYVVGRDGGKESTPSAGEPGAPVTNTWLSGASGTGVADGSYAKWRGTPVAIAGTWNDNFESQENQWSLQPTFELADWQGDVDVAVGGIFASKGETWAAAATGAYDDRWRATLTNLAKAWEGRPGTMYIRFAHEFNGDWYDWKVTAADVPAFKETWRRFRALQLEIAPDAELVFCPNRETAGSLAYDWRTAFPGSDQVDVLAVDTYNQYPFVTDQETWDSSVMTYDPYGAPRGLERHRQFAENRGLPFAISEWSSNADMGDSPAFLEAMHAWLEEHGGTGPGQVLYEIQFNNGDYGDGNFQFFPTSRQPDAAGEYQKLW